MYGEPHDGNTLCDLVMDTPLVDVVTPSKYGEVADLMCDFVCQ